MSPAAPSTIDRTLRTDAGLASSLRMSEDQTSPTTSVSTYLGGPQLLDTMGLELVAGRRFEPDEFVDWEAFNAPGAEINIPAVIVTRTLAERARAKRKPK